MRKLHNGLTSLKTVILYRKRATIMYILCLGFVSLAEVFTTQLGAQCPIEMTIDLTVGEFSCGSARVELTYGWPANDLVGYQEGARIVESGGGFGFNDLGNEAGSWSVIPWLWTTGTYTYEVALKDPDGKITVCKTQQIVIGEDPNPPLSCASGPVNASLIGNFVEVNLPVPSITTDCEIQSSKVTGINVESGESIVYNQDLLALGNQLPVTFTEGGEYDFVWEIFRATDGLAVTCTTRVEIVDERCMDQAPPTISCDPIEISIADFPAVYDIPVPQYNDDCGVTNGNAWIKGPSTNGQWIQLVPDLLVAANTVSFNFTVAGVHDIDWYVGDGVHDDVECSTTITISDETCQDQAPPSISCDPEPIKVPLVNGSVTVDIPFPTFEDDCEVDKGWAFIRGPSTNGEWEQLVDNVTEEGISATYTFSTMGAHEIDWNVRDGADNETSCRTTVEIVEEQPTEIQISFVNPTDCNSSDGSITLENIVDGCPGAESVSVLFNKPGASIIFSVTKDIQKHTFSNLTQGAYEILLSGFDASDNPVDCGLFDREIVLTPTNNNYTGPIITCQDMVMAQQDENGQVTVDVDLPNIQGNCSFGVDGADAGLRLPDGTLIDLGPLDMSQRTLSLPLVSEGSYLLEWRAWDENDVESLCYTEIVIKPNGPIRVSSALCDDPNAFVASVHCDDPPAVASVEVSGVGNFRPNYGLTKVFVNGLVPANFTGTLLLQAPNGSLIILANSERGSFNTYDGTQTFGNFSVDLLMCPGAPDHAGSVDFSDPFISAQASPLQTFRDIDGNGGSADGQWNLLFCSSDRTQTFEIYCLELDFGTICPEIRDFSTTPASCGAADGSITITEFEAGYCGTVDFSLDGENWQESATFNDLAAGLHTVYISDEGSNCNKGLTLRVPGADDLAAPVISNCPPNQVVTIGDDGRAVFTITEPTFSDDCNVAKTELLACRPDGTMGTYDPEPGQVTSWTVPSGSWVFKWTVWDASGKSATCETTITTRDRCDDDKEAPTFDYCPEDTTLVAGADGQALLNIIDPTASDNCFVESEVNDYTNPNGFMEQNPSEPGQSNEWTFLLGKSTVVWTATDSSGNSTTCTMMVTVVDSVDACTFEKTPPVFQDCPADQTIDVTSGATVEWSITQPNFSDECGIASATVTTIGPDGGEGTLLATAGEVLTGQGDRPGTYTYIWRVTDNAGNATTCTSVVTLTCPPAECEDPDWFMASNCSAFDPESFTAGACQTDEEAVIEIPVHGVGLMSPARGLLEVEIHALQSGGFTGKFWLVSPDGQYYKLADAEEGSFRSFRGDDPTLRLKFRACGDLPDTRGRIPDEDYDGGTFKPLSDLLMMNFNGVNADGTWKVIACNDQLSDFTLEIICAKLHFGEICPVVGRLIGSAGQCTIEGGSFTYRVLDQGYCQDREVGVELISQEDSTVYVVEGTRIEGLPAGKYTQLAGYKKYDSRGTYLGLECLTKREIEIGVKDPDQNAPVIVEVPKDFTYALRYQESIEMTLVHPFYADACPIFSTDYQLITPSGDTLVTQPFEAGADLSLTLDQCGIYTVRWVVTDGSGNVASKSTTITVREDDVSEFCADICQDTSAVVVPECGACAPLEIPIEVIGVGEMSTDYGLYSVSIAGNFQRKFSGNIELISPEGYTYWLASPDAGSFPTFTGDEGGVPFDVTFRRCNTPHDDADVVPTDIPGSTFSPIAPIQRLSYRNREGDGTWLLRVCNTDGGEKFTIDCARLTFGKISPEIIEIAVGAAECETGSLGSLDIITVDPGFWVENGLAFTIDGGENWTTSRSFSGLAAGDYEAIVGYPLTNEKGVTNYFLRDTMDFTVRGDGDQEDPELFYCPKNVTVDLSVSNQWSIVEPLFADDCEVTSTKMTLVDIGTNTIIEEREIQPGDTITRTATAVGKFDIYWDVMDVFGMTSCTTFVDVIAPVVQQIAQNDVEVGMQASEASLQVSPTIAVNEVMVEANFPDQSDKKLRIVDGLGQIILQMDLGQSNHLRQQLSLASLASGMYFITVQDEQEMKTVRVIRQ